MSHFKTAAVAAMMLLSLGAAAQAAEPAKADKPHHPRFEALDTNKDGGVSLDELKAGMANHPKMLARADKFFARLDANQDGKVTKDEFKAMRRHRGHHGNHGDHGDKPATKK